MLQQGIKKGISEGTKKKKKLKTDRKMLCNASD
jgi:hypothetical protein